MRRRTTLLSSGCDARGFSLAEMLVVIAIIGLFCLVAIPAVNNYIRAGKVRSASALLVVFICNHCPYVKHIRAGLAQLARDYQPRGVAVVRQRRGLAGAIVLGPALRTIGIRHVDRLRVNFQGEAATWHCEEGEGRAAGSAFGSYSARRALRLRRLAASACRSSGIGCCGSAPPQTSHRVRDLH